MANFANYGNLESILTGYANKINGISEVVPSDATTSNKLATQSDLPSAVTGNPEGSATAGNLTKLQIGSDIYDVPSGGGSSDPYDGRKTRYTISASNWSSSPNSDGYYTYSLTLTNPLTTSTSPNVYIAGASDSTQPTATESTMFSYVKRCNLSSSTTLVLYATTKPTSTFYVFVGAEGGGIEEIYSTSETVIGKWNNAVLYRKVLTVPSYPNNTTAYLATGTTNAKVKNMYGYMQNGTVFLNVPTVRTQTALEYQIDVLFYKDANGDYLNIACNADRSSFSGEIVIEYTKS